MNNVLASVESARAPAPEQVPSEPIVLQAQGSFAVGGTVITNAGTFDPFRPTPAGQTLHGDHVYVSWQIPVHARSLPLVFLHGFGQFSKTWESTPDGRVSGLSARSATAWKSRPQHRADKY